MLGISRGAVRAVLESNSAEVPHLERAELAQPHRARILELYKHCKGNLVRMHEELQAEGAELSYSALTAFCRRHGIGHKPPEPVGKYSFAPGEEMQHDTSPHHAEIGGKRVAVQSASLVLGHSRMVFVQMYPRFRRFECKLFLTDALRYFGGACRRCMIDNTHVVVLSGTGRDMVPTAEMAAFGERFGFEFQAHAVGDANRSAKVERGFHYVENNFLVGRTFSDWSHLNVEAQAWCDRVNARPRRHLHASPRELFATESVHLVPLPQYVPDVYALHHRIVDTEGYVSVHKTRYSAPWRLIGHQVEVHELRDKIELHFGPRLVATHSRCLDALDVRITDPTHRPPRHEGVWARKRISQDEQRIGNKAPLGGQYVALLRKRGRGSARDLRWLCRMLIEYPCDATAGALEEALHYGMADLERLERMILRRVHNSFFVLPSGKDTDSENDE
ncbi:MAG TPA: IS21 family transposase [Polyangiaceae bacterium]